MAYAISEEDAGKAPRITGGEDSYVQEMYLKGRKYHLYVHRSLVISYMYYGLLAARAEILKLKGEHGNPCMLAGYKGSYKYGREVFNASALPSGSSLHKCRENAIQALKVNESSFTNVKCTFGGIWNGGGGDGMKNLFVASFFFDKAAEDGFVDKNLAVAKVRPADFEDAAKRACETSLEDAAPRQQGDGQPCPQCGRVHHGKCMWRTFRCFFYKEEGHKVVDCSKNKGPTTDRVFVMHAEEEEAEPDTTLITGDYVDEGTRGAED